ncbi:putative uncharacterized protein DDB_G0289263 [Papaver somniferum]|uniref:putative uncharacterized protein DDB_G0289263 n=1 Tax=Papaver somniferum TaxID=3469 RepID=UPI000E6F4AF9|nr:putative uncharacterized protein DDB_G0289263 [Papaver somniferum]
MSNNESKKLEEEQSTEKVNLDNSVPEPTPPEKPLPGDCCGSGCGSSENFMVSLRSAFTSNTNNTNNNNNNNNNRHQHHDILSPIQFNKGFLVSTDLYGYVNGEIIEPPRRITINGIEGNQYIIDYLKKIKTISDSLAAIGEKVSDEDLIMFLLNGLGSEYDVFVFSSQNRETPYTFGEIKARLLSHEQFLSERQHQSTNLYDDQTTTAFYGRNSSNDYNNNRRNGGYTKNGNGGSYKNIQYQHGSSSNSSNGQSHNGSN